MLDGGYRILSLVSAINAYIISVLCRVAEGGRYKAKKRFVDTRTDSNNGYEPASERLEGCSADRSRC